MEISLNGTLFYRFNRFLNRYDTKGNLISKVFPYIVHIIHNFLMLQQLSLNWTELSTNEKNI